MDGSAEGRARAADPDLRWGREDLTWTSVQLAGDRRWRVPSCGGCGERRGGGSRPRGSGGTYSCRSSSSLAHGLLAPADVGEAGRRWPPARHRRGRGDGVYLSSFGSPSRPSQPLLPGSPCPAPRQASAEPQDGCYYGTTCGRAPSPNVVAEPLPGDYSRLLAHAGGDAAPGGRGREVEAAGGGAAMRAGHP